MAESAIPMKLYSKSRNSIPAMIYFFFWERINFPASTYGENTGELINLVHFLIFNRECSTTEPASLKGIQVTFMNNSLIDLSSTKIRKNSAQVILNRIYLQEVFKYLQENDLFPITN